MRIGWCVLWLTWVVGHCHVSCGIWVSVSTEGRTKESNLVPHWWCTGHVLSKPLGRSKVHECSSLCRTDQTKTNNLGHGKGIYSVKYNYNTDIYESCIQKTNMQSKQSTEPLNQRNAPGLTYLIYIISNFHYPQFSLVKVLVLLSVL